MTDATRPAPLVPAEVDLRDFGYMPLDVLRLRDSDLAALATGDEFKAAVLLWCVSWHQVPAASLPDDDRLLARYSGAGAGWKKVREEALRGFVKCLDGRLYHPTVAEKANEAWAAKAAQRARTKAATEAREAKRRAADAQRDVERDDERHGPRNEQRDVARDVVQGKGEGREGKGEGYSVPDGTGGTPPGPPIPPTDRDLVFANGVTLLTAAGVSDRNARSFLAAQCKAHGEAAVRQALDRCATERPIEPVPWIVASLGAPAATGQKPRKSEALMAGNVAAAQRFLEGAGP